MKIILLTVALSLTPTLLHAQTIKPLLVTLSLLRATDATLTRDLAHRYGGHEVNPTLPQNPRAISALLAGETIAQVWALDKLHQTHPRIAKVIAWGSIGIEGWVVMHNAKQYR